MQEPGSSCSSLTALVTVRATKPVSAFPISRDVYHRLRSPHTTRAAPPRKQGEGDKRGGVEVEQEKGKDLRQIA